MDAPDTTPKHGLGETLTHKLGPLPVWAWGLIGGVGVAILLRKSGGGGGSSAAGPLSPDAQGSVTAGTLDTGGSGGGGSGVPADQYGTLPVDPNAGQYDWQALLDSLSSVPADSASSGPLVGYDQPTQYTYDPATGRFSAINQPANNYLLSAGVYTDVGAPAYGASLASLSSYWKSLGSPTTLQAGARAGGISGPIHAPSSPSAPPVPVFTPAPRIDTTLLPSGGASHPHTVTGGF